MSISPSYLHSLNTTSDIAPLVSYLEKNPQSPIFLHPKCPIWLQTHPNLLSIRESIVNQFPSLDRNGIEAYYDAKIDKTKDYESVSFLMKEKNLALYCIDSNKLILPDTLDQFYRCGTVLFDQYRMDRFQWISSTLEDYWGKDTLYDILVMDKTISDILHSKREDNGMNDAEWDAYWKIQWTILKACFGAGHYELGFEKLKLLKDQLPTDNSVALIVNCLELLQGSTAGSYWMQDLYEAFDYCNLIKRLEQQSNDSVYLYGLDHFSSIIKKKMLIGYLNIVKQVPLFLLADQFGTSMDNFEGEISWLITVLKLPFIIENGNVIWSPNNNGNDIKDKVSKINNMMNDNIIQGEALQTATLINLAFS